MTEIHNPQSGKVHMQHTCNCPTKICLPGHMIFRAPEIVKSRKYSWAFDDHEFQLKVVGDHGHIEMTIDKYTLAA